MNHYWIFFFGLTLGAMLGMFLAGILGMSSHGDHLADLADAYTDGVRNGKRIQGNVLKNGAKKTD